jgi:hypothetical protein
MADSLITPACTTTLGPSYRQEDGRWVAGWCIGPGGEHCIVLPLGVELETVPLDVLQRAVDDAGRKASVKTPFWAGAFGTTLAPINPWNPIRSAPHAVPLLVAWTGVDSEPHIAMRWNGRWIAHREGYELDPPPTHWMPLPAPPLSVRSNGQGGPP